MIFENEEQFFVIDSALNNLDTAPLNKLTCPRCQFVGLAPVIVKLARLVDD